MALEPRLGLVDRPFCVLFIKENNVEYINKKLIPNGFETGHLYPKLI